MLRSLLAMSSQHPAELERIRAWPSSESLRSIAQHLLERRACKGWALHPESANSWRECQRWSLSPCMATAQRENGERSYRSPPALDSRQSIDRHSQRACQYERGEQERENRTEQSWEERREDRETMKRERRGCERGRAPRMRAPPLRRTGDALSGSEREPLHPRHRGGCQR